MRIFWSALAALLLSGATGALAQAAYPTSPIKIVVGFPPGVPADVMSRILAPKLAEGLGQPVVVVNKPGAGSSIGADAVAKAAPDGYTLYISSIANTVNHNVNKLPFNFVTDL